MLTSDLVIHKVFFFFFVIVVITTIIKFVTNGTALNIPVIIPFIVIYKSFLLVIFYVLY